MHEDLGRQHEIKQSSERSFGIVFAAAFAVIGLWPLMGSGTPRYWALTAAAIFLVLAFVWTAPLGPLNRLWARLGFLLHTVMNPLVMGLLFFGTVLPIGLMLRLAGKDLLNLRRDPAAGSYWIKRDPPGPKPETMIHQF